MYNNRKVLKVLNMLEMNKNDFIELLEMQANAKMLSSDRRRRLDGRLEKNTIDLLASFLPNTCKYLITSNGCVRADWFKINNTRLKNLHIFNNSSIFITIFILYINCIIVEYMQVFKSCIINFKPVSTNTTIRSY